MRPRGVSEDDPDESRAFSASSMEYMSAASSLWGRRTLVDASAIEYDCPPSADVSEAQR